MMKKIENIVKKAVFIACVSVMLVAGAPPGRVSAEDCMQKIYECLVKEDSDFSKRTKEIEKLTEGQLVYSAFVHGNIITVTADGKDYYAESDSSWDYTLEGDYLTYVPKEGDYQGEAYFGYLIDATADYLGMDSDLVNGYIAGIHAKKLTSKYYIVETDVEENPTKYKLYVGAAYEMDDVLNSVYLDDDSLYLFEALGSDSTSSYAQVGKVRMVLNGKRTSVDFVFGEHGELTGLTYRSVIETVKRLKPAGYEEFLDNYKELSEVSTDTYQVSYVTDVSELPKSLQGENHYKFIRLHFSAPALSASSLTLGAGGVEFLWGEGCEAESWRSSNKKVAVVESGKITALKKGTADITATLADGRKLSCKVTVTSSPTLKISGKAYKKNKTYTVKKGRTIKAEVKGRASSVDPVYKSSKKKVAKVSFHLPGESVKIKGRKKGTSKITIKVNGVSFVFRVKVK